MPDLLCKAMVNDTCRQCGQSIGAQDSFCSRCGTSLAGSALLAPTSSSGEVLLDGVHGIEAPVSDDGQRWQSTRAILGLGAVVLAVLIALSALGGFGDGPDDGSASINDAEDVAAEPTASATPEPTATPTPKPTETPRPDDPDGPASIEGIDDAEVEQVIAGWDQVAEIYDGGGLFTVQRDRRNLVVVDLATGRWQSVEVPFTGNGFTPNGIEMYTTKEGIIGASGDQPILRRWDNGEPVALGEPGQTVLGASPDIVIMSEEDVWFLGRPKQPLTVIELATGRTKSLDVSGGFGPTSFMNFFGALGPLYAADLGDGAATWSFDDGWTDRGPGTPIAVGTNGLLMESCVINSDDAISCILEIVELDGTRTEAHPDVEVTSPYGTILSPNLRWVGAADWPRVGEPTFQLTNLQTGETVDSPSSPESGMGTWLGETDVFASLGSRRSLTLTNAATGQVVEIDEVPWSESTSTNFQSMATWIDIPFPESVPPLVE